MLPSKYKTVKMPGKSSCMSIDEMDLPGAGVAVLGWGLFRPSLTTGRIPPRAAHLAMPSTGWGFLGLLHSWGMCKGKIDLGTCVQMVMKGSC